ncbi:MAG: esterase-like activity of phytase family protein [Candidatus Bipolaricaulota bacterium]|nr:MAG: esterase-like activity of phytase family protein [Candidatus Bipolaricaulota bacterium]
MNRITAVAGLICALIGLSGVAIGLDFLGSFEPPREGWTFGGVNVGEISGLSHAANGTYYAIGDDRGENVIPPGVLYEMEIKVLSSGIDSVEVTGLVQLDSDISSPGVQPFGPEEIDGEEVLWTTEGFIVCSERDGAGAPWIGRYTHDGLLIEEIPVPEKYIPIFHGEDQVRGVRRNLSFEAATVTPDGTTLYVASEQALVQDGDVSTADAGSPVRIIEFDLTGEVAAVVGEYVYVTEPLFVRPAEGQYGDNGVPGIAYVGHITPEIDLIVMERSYVSGAGNHIGLFGVKLAPYIYDRERIRDTSALADPEAPFTGFTVHKIPLLRISDDAAQTDVAEFDPDNMEAIAVGPKLPTGNHILLLASDDNFNPKYQRNVVAAFEILPDDVKMSAVVLGSGGGPREDNVSGYMLFPAGAPDEAIALDAGTLTVGIRTADELGNLWDFRVPEGSNATREGYIYQNIKAYLLSHAHLDHTLAHYLNGPADVYGAEKPIMGIQSTIDNITNGIYNWKTWADFVALGYYQYAVLEPGIETPIPGTSMTVEAFVVSHGAPYESTAFLIRQGDYYVLYFGDVGPEGVEDTGLITAVWERVAPLIAGGELLGMFLEISYAEGRPDSLLFGHLTPSWMMAELHALAQLVNPADPYRALAGLPVCVTHVKPVFQMVEPPLNVIARQLKQINDLGVEFVFPYQGMRIDFRPL